MIWKLNDLIEHCNSCHAEINGKWIPARPLSSNIGSRIKAALAVLIGKADAFTWSK